MRQRQALGSGLELAYKTDSPSVFMLPMYSTTQCILNALRFFLRLPRMMYSFSVAATLYFCGQSRLRLGFANGSCLFPVSRSLTQVDSSGCSRIPLYYRDASCRPQIWSIRNSLKAEPHLHLHNLMTARFLIQLLSASRNADSSTMDALKWIMQCSSNKSSVLGTCIITHIKNSNMCVTCHLLFVILSSNSVEETYY